MAILKSFHLIFFIGSILPIEQLLTTDSLGTNNKTCKLCNCYYPTADVMFLNCAHRELTTIPTNLWPKSNLNTISVSFIGNNFGILKKLKPARAQNIHMTFAYCKLTEIEHSAFIEITNLVHLDLSHNQLTGEAIHSDIFQGKFHTVEYEPLKKLQVINLSYNNIHALHKKCFEHVPNLKALYLNNNPLKVLGLTTVAAISSTPDLQILDLSSTNLYHVSDEAFALFKDLIVLKLSNNFLHSVPESLVYVGESLKVLDFSGNAVEEFNEKSFYGLKSLTHLNISGMYNLKAIRSDTFQWLENLNALYISNNPKLSYIDKDAFGDLKANWTLSELYINKNSFHQVSIQLAAWEKLVQLDMSDNPWRCDCQLYHTIKKLKTKYRERNQKFPVCYEPTSLSGISLYNIPSKICDRPRLNGTQNSIFDMLFEDERSTGGSNKKTKGSMSRRTKVMWFLFICTAIVLGLTIVAFSIKIYLAAKKAKETKFSPVKYSNANTNVSNN